MAYRDPQTLTCPACGLAGNVTWVVGVGPNTRPGEGPAYISVLDAGPFQTEPHGAATAILCPKDATELARRP